MAGWQTTQTSQPTWRSVTLYTLGVLLLYILVLAVLVISQVQIEEWWPGLESKPIWSFAVVLLDTTFLSCLSLLALRKLGFRFAALESGSAVSRMAEGVLTGGVIFAALRLFFYLMPIPLETHPSMEELLSQQDPTGITLLLAGILVLAPISEELLVRGLFQNAWRAILPFWPAILLINFLFALLHVLPGLMIYSFLAGILISTAYERSRSILMAIAAHFAINFCSVLEVFLLQG